jgi:hypothetical protein
MVFKSDGYGATLVLQYRCVGPQGETRQQSNERALSPAFASARREAADGAGE